MLSESHVDVGQSHAKESLPRRNPQYWGRPSRIGYEAAFSAGQPASATARQAYRHWIRSISAPQIFVRYLPVSTWRFQVRRSEPQIPFARRTWHPGQSSL